MCIHRNTYVHMQRPKESTGLSELELQGLQNSRLALWLLGSQLQSSISWSKYSKSASISPAWPPSTLTLCNSPYGLSFE